MNDLDKEAGEMLSDRAAQLVAAKNRLEELSNNFDVRKMAARMDENQEDTIFSAAGWQRMMWIVFLKRSKMMTKSSLSLKMTMMLLR